MARQRKAAEETVQLQVSSEFVDVGAGEELPEVAAYAFGPGGAAA